MGPLTRKRVVIIGGGISGLATAFRIRQLAKKREIPLEVTLLEREGHLGGRIRTFETATRNTTDINAVPVLKSLTHLPVILDPSHSTGHFDYVAAIARAAVAAGADGLIVEVHPDPAHAVSDGRQSLKPEKFAAMVKQVSQIAEVMDRRIASVQTTVH